MLNVKLIVYNLRQFSVNGINLKVKESKLNVIPAQTGISIKRIKAMNC